ncbi:MAG: grasp-with-spasm system ATP-grasp peptide maturase [Bacteroidales bacterium]|jgi:ATP-GRASP peptide maturase of grasp-with-spasm system|nr:grasp-with-spasm system ATP-grasp peptide maturase [Bacteroidales bacterium]
MILIITNNEDASTNDVIDWLDFYDADFFRINASDIFNYKNFCIYIDNYDDTKIIINNREINLKEINSIWYRRWGYSFNKEYNDIQISSSLQTEFKDISNYLFRLFKNIPSINVIEDFQLDKLTQLEYAKKAGLLIPDTLVSNKRSNCYDFIDSESSYITKPLKAKIYLQKGNDTYLNYTSQIDKNKLPIEDYFFPCLIQKEITKDIEIRTFILDKKCYSMAIFSQSDNQTKVDFRNYNLEKPNRHVPYKLPDEIEEKLLLFMEYVNLNCGSIDIILSKDSEYYFLEVNPVGQFGMVSIPCNYCIEEKIALKLIEFDKNGK